MVQTDTKRLVIGDFLIWYADHRYCFESGTITNDATTGGTAGSIPVSPATELDPIGQPVKLASGVWQFASAADVVTGGAGNVDGVVVSGPKITSLAADAATADEYTIMRRGPGLYNEGEIPTTDAYGDSITKSEYIDALVALDVPVKDLKISANTSEQTT